MLSYDDIFNLNDPSQLKQAIKLLDDFNKMYTRLVNNTKSSSSEITRAQQEIINSVNQMGASLKGLDPANEKHRKQIIETANATELAAKQMGNLKNAEAALAGSTDNLTKEQQQYNREVAATIKLDKDIQNLEVKLASLNKKKASDAAALRKEISLRNKELRESARIALKNVPLYEKENAELLRLRDAYRQVALQQGINSKEALKLQSAHQATFNKLKTIDQNLGNYSRSVGNYASGWNGLNNSINQLSREAPAFAVSLNTGFLALSNNIPILADEIKNLTARNKELIAQGKPTKSVFRSIIGAIISWQTALSIGVTLLTLYGGKIAEWIKQMVKGKDVMEAMNGVNKKGAENAAANVAQFTALVAVATSDTKSKKDQLAAIEDLNREFPTFNTNLLKEKENHESIAVAIKDEVDQLLKRAKAQAAMSILQEKFNTLLTKQIEVEQKAVLITDENTKAAEAYDKLTERQQARLGKLPESVRAYRRALKEMNEAQEDVNNTQKIFVDLFDENTFEESKKAAKDLFDEFRAIVSEGNLKELTRQANEFARDVKNFEVVEKELKASKAAASEFNSMLDSIITTMDDPKWTSWADDEKRALEDATLQAKIYASELEAIQQKKEFLVSTSFAALDLAGNQYFTNESIRRNNDFEAFRDDQERRLELVGDNEQARAAIEQQIAERERQLRIEEAKADRNAKIFSIAIGAAEKIAQIKFTAAALAANPITAPFAAVASAQIPVVLGFAALQTGLVLSQPLPAYEKGGLVDTDSPIITSEKGPEMAVTPEGKLILTGNKGAEVRTDIPKGSYIFDHDKTNKILSAKADDEKAISIIQKEAMKQKQMISSEMKVFFKKENDYLIQGFRKIMDERPHQSWNVEHGRLASTMTKANTSIKNWKSKNSD